MDVKDWRQIIDKSRVLTEKIEPFGGEVSEIDGKSKQSAIRYLHNKISKAKITSKIYKDDYWLGVKAIFKLLDEMGIRWDIDSTKYEQDDNNRPVRKRWYINLYWAPKIGNHLDKKFGGHIVAAGAGSVQDPLDKYDVTINFY